MRLPLYVRVLIGVGLGIAVGAAFGAYEFTNDLGDLGLLVIRALKMLAVPLVFFAVIDAIVLALMNLFHPGDAWHGHIGELTGRPGLHAVKQAPPGTTLSPIANLARW